MNSKTTVKAIRNLRPEAEFSFDADDLSTLSWIKLDSVAPTIAEIEAEIKKVEAADKAILSERESTKAALLERLNITADEAKLLLA
jgi:hypothetical protein